MTLRLYQLEASPSLVIALSLNEHLTLFNDFEVTRVRTLVDNIFQIGEYDPKHIPDHSWFCWSFESQNYIG